MKRPGIEKQFDWNNIDKEIRFTKVAVNKVFSNKIQMITEMASNQWNLVGIYLLGTETKKQLGLKYEENLLLKNVILTQPYWTFSIILLTKNTMYGSARPILRQFFEALMVAKYSEYDPSFIKKWSSKQEGRDSLNEISLVRDIILPLERKNKPTKELRRIWTDFNDMTHQSKWSQQMPRIATNKAEMIDWLLKSSFFQNIHFTLDLLFMMLCMYNHLLVSHLGSRAYRWYMGYEQDPYGLFKKERQYKKRLKELINAYYDINQEFPNAVMGIKKRILEYQRNWS